MSNGKILRLKLKMSPRAVDSLRAASGKSGVSKYALPMMLFPENGEFTARVSASDENHIVLSFEADGKSYTMTGSIKKDSYFCRELSARKAAGREYRVRFIHERTEEFTYIDPNVKKRLDVWYDYIEGLMKKADESSFRFFCRTASVKNGNVAIAAYDLEKSAELKGLTVGFTDDKGRPAWGFGSAVSFLGGILTVKLFSDNAAEIMRQLTGGVKLIAYDGAADITCKRMKSGLDRLCGGEAVNRRLPDFLFEPKNADRSVGGIRLEADELLSDNMNPEQKEAVEGAVNAKDLYLIQGPPGTGKTTVIAEICYQNAVRGLKTLIVSQSNLAVDNAISRVMRCADIRALRKGDNSRVEEEGLPFVEDNIVGTWIAQIASDTEKKDELISDKLSELKAARARLPEILSDAENVINSGREVGELKPQLYYYSRFLEETKANREKFFELIDIAYEKTNMDVAQRARKFYPEDFTIPNNIYNKLENIYSDIRADMEMMLDYRNELDFLNEYTRGFSKQFAYIRKKVEKELLDRISFDGIFSYTDEHMITSIYDEGERIIRSKPRGLKKLLFGKRWKQLAGIHLRRAESLMKAVQNRTVRLCEKMEDLENDRVYVDNVKTFRLCLDALGEDFYNQYYKYRAEYDKIYEKYNDAQKEHDYAMECLKEKISTGFYSKALKNIDLDDISLEKIEYSVNEYYRLRSERYTKWLTLLRDWRKCISDGGQRSYGALKKLYIDNANVIGITCIQSGTKDFNENYPSFDCVIIDEASKSTPPDIILPMLKGRKVILVGDHKQLPPFIDSTAYDELENEDETLKELIKVSLFEELYERSESSQRTMLFRQYRMHRDIAALINQFYVDTDAGRLESPASEYRQHCCQGKDISSDNHVMWYDLPNTPENYEKMSGRSFYNEAEADTVKRLLCLIESDLQRNGAKKSVGVITFYDAQVRLLEKEIVESGFCKRFASMTLRIGSVDRFQGMEEDIIIVSFVRNNRGHSVGFARDNRRINVAMSRAKDLLMIVGCSENFKGSSDPGASQMFGNIYKIISRLDGVRDYRDISAVELEDGDFDPTRSLAKASLPQGSADTGTYSDDISILDEFILRAAYEFRARKLSVKNISNVLGIAEVFVSGRLRYLQSRRLVTVVNNLVKISSDGEKNLKNLLETNKSKQ